MYSGNERAHNVLT